MKRFLIKTMLFGLLFLILVIVGFVLPVTPRASKSLLYAKIQKDNLLRNTDSPRIIFVGGSNLSFGINSQIIKDSLHLNPINTAIQLRIGLEYMMDNTLKYIRKGDVIILAPEYIQFYGRFIHGGEELLRTVADIDYRDLFNLDKEQIKNISKYFIKYSFSKLKPTEYFGFKESDIYSVNSFNKYGDAYGHWNMQQQIFPSLGEIKTKYNPNAIKLINKFKIELEKKGATLFITYPSFHTTSYNNSIKQIKRVEKELMKNNFNILGTPERYKMTDTMMFNTPYHLLKKGVDYRTKLLIEDVNKVRTHNASYTRRWQQ